jgi:uncharacterized lipoprotein YbaY/heat shock protein HslJ
MFVGYKTLICGHRQHGVTMRLKSILGLLCFASAAGCAAPSAAPTVTVSGTATYLARIAMPPEAVLTVRIEDVSIADRVAPVLAEVREPFGARQVPIPFALQVPRAKIDPKARYSLRAEISVGGQKRFVTDRDLPVLTQGGLEKYDLLLTAAAPAAPAAPAAQRWRGEFTYLADAANFVDCASGKRWPVANAGDYLATERGYLAARSAPGAPLMATFNGRVEVRPAMEGPPREHMVIERLGGFEPGARCAAAAALPLRGTAWRLIELEGVAVAAAPGQPRDIGLTLSATQNQVSGFAGCNNLVGGFESSGNALKFGGMAGTMMACDAAAMDRERKFHQALGAVTAFRIEGAQLSLLAGARPVARFSAAPSR